MIHRYNLADLNLSDRTAELPKQTGFKGRLDIKEVPCWQTSTQAAFGAGKPLDAQGEKTKFDYLKNTQGGLSAPRPFE